MNVWLVVLKSSNWYVEDGQTISSTAKTEMSFSTKYCSYSTGTCMTGWKAIVLLVATGVCIQVLVLVVTVSFCTVHLRIAYYDMACCRAQSPPAFDKVFVITTYFASPCYIQAFPLRTSKGQQLLESRVHCFAGHDVIFTKSSHLDWSAGSMETFFDASRSIVQKESSESSGRSKNGNR